MSAYVKVGGEFAVNPEETNDEFGAQITAFADGGYLMTWIARLSDEPGVYEQVVMGQRYDVSGAKLGGEFQVNQSAPGILQSVSTAEFAGGFAVTWQNAGDVYDGTGAGIMTRLFDSQGNALGDEFRVNTNFEILAFYPTAISLSNGGFVITWDDRNTLRAQIFDANGARVGGEIVTSTEGDAWYATSSVVALAGGGFVVAWRSDVSGNYELYARIFDNDGVPAGAKFSVNAATTTRAEYQPHLTALADGGFVALWEVGDQAATEDIRGQRFNASGAKVGGEFVVNQQTTGDQYNAQATALADGGFLVTWTTSDATQDGSGSAVKARQYGADGQPAGAEYLLNTVTADYQRINDLETLADGRVLAVWHSSDTWGDEAQLRAQFLYSGANGAPQITSGGGGASASFSITENATEVTAVAATDSDGPQPVTYWIGGGADGALFAIDKTTGALSFAAGPDFESPIDADTDGVYEVVVEARDGLNVDSQAISVTVGNTADGLSFFRTTVRAPENSLAAATLLASGGDGAPMSYAIVGGADAAQFVLDAATGELSFLAEQDFEAPGDADGDGIYEVEVTAGDGTLSVTRTISVTLESVNEAPSFVSATEWSVDEGENFVGTLEIVDPEDEGVTFYLVGGADGQLFDVNPYTGEFAFLDMPDFEAPADADGDNVYEVEVGVADNENWVTQTIYVTVTDADAEPLSFVQTDFEVPEVAPFSITLEVTGDAEPLYFWISGGEDSWLFNIDNYTGQLTYDFGAFNFEAPNDYGADNVYEVEVYASTDQGEIVQTITINVRDEGNEELFFITDGAWAATENETFVGTALAYTAQYSPLTYTLPGGDDAALFSVDSETGEISFLNAPDFEAPADYDGDNVYSFVLEVFDGYYTRYQDVTITVTDDPELGSPFVQTEFAVDEHTGLWTTLELIDPDPQYSAFWISGGADSDFFLIDGETGELHFSGEDYEYWADADGDNVFEVEVTAAANGGDVTDTVYVTLQNVDEAPEIYPWPISITENTANGGWVTAYDPENLPLTYAIAGGADGALFTINSSNGFLRFTSPANFEAPADAGGNNVYDVLVEVSDGTYTTVGAFTVTVLNQAEAPVISSNGGGASANLTVNENATAVTTVVASDPESGVTYSLVAGGDAARFAINASTGALTFLAAPNYEAPSDGGANNVYNVTVRASDGSLSDTQALAITVGNVNEAPVIGSNGGGAAAAIAVNENATAVATVAAADPEGSVTYAIAGGADAARFTIDASTGALSFVAAPDFEAPADADGNNVYEVVVSASDGSLVDTQTLSVTVGNVNEAPVITSNGGGASAAVSVGENSTGVTTVAASDPEGGFSFSLAGGADAALFSIDASTGALSFVSAPDYEAPADADGNNVYEVIVSASDGGLSDTQALSVTIGNVNEAPMIVSDGGGTSAALELDEGQTAVTTVVAQDLDGPGALAYAISGGPDAALFAIDAVTGALSLVAAPDFEAPVDQAADNFYNVTVSASDGEFSVFQAVSVLIRDVNEGVTITSPGAAATSENQTAVTTVTAEDLDGDSIAFAILGGADAARFAIDASTGALSFVSAPDFEAPADADGNNVYEVVVSASDGSLTDTKAMSITVGNVAETPVITSGGGGATAGYAASENSLAVATIVASDPEGGVTYALAGGADAARFAIDASTGALSFVTAPNFEAPADADGNNVYEVVVSASDGSLTDTQTLSVTVGNVNEAPVITTGGGGAAASYTLNENLAAVATVAATDPESGVTYAIAGGADAARFAINASTGALSFVAAPDFDAPTDAGGNNVYEVTVSSSDGSLVDTQALSITVGNLSDGVTLTGTAQANTLTGTYEEDTISGLGGSDTLRGMAAADVIDGGDGQDRLIGGAGADVLTGGTKADVFELEALSDSTLAASDRIVDFNRSQGDRIELLDIDANALLAGNQAFAFIGTAAFSNVAGQLRYGQQGGDTYIWGDVNGDSVADFQVVLDPLVSLIASDFVL